MSMLTKTERVVICGAGPVGLVTALALCRAGVPVTIVEADATVCGDLRAVAYHPPSLDMLEDIGFLEPLSAIGYPQRYVRFSDRLLGEDVQLDMEVLARRYRNPVSLLAGQQWFTQVGYQLLLQEDCEFLFDHRVLDATQTDDEVVLTVFENGAQKEIRAPWVLGCDGASSAIRRSQSIEFEGYTWPERFLMIDCKTDLSVRYGTNFMADGPDWKLTIRIPYGPGPDDWVQRLVSGIHPDLSDEDALRPELAQSRLKALMPSESDHPIVSTRIYKVHQRVAKTFRYGRILLAGDAAHINNPMGGQGLNSGIHDAFNLAPKLAGVWRGETGTEPLDLYDRQRRITNWEFIQRVSVENKMRNEETDIAKRRAAITYLKSLVDDDDARFAFFMRWSMGDSLDYAADITLDHPAEAPRHAMPA